MRFQVGSNYVYDQLPVPTEVAAVKALAPNKAPPKPRPIFKKKATAKSRGKLAGNPSARRATVPFTTSPIILIPTTILSLSYNVSLSIL